MQIYINRLSARERAQLIERRFTHEELAELHAALLRGQRARRRNLRILSVAVPLGCLVLTGLMVARAGLTPAVLIAGVAVLLMVALALAAAWFAAIGLYARQFNDAIDEGYPELLGRLHL